MRRLKEVILTIVAAMVSLAPAAALAEAPDWSNATAPVPLLIEADEQYRSDVIALLREMQEGVIRPETIERVDALSARLSEASGATGLLKLFKGRQILSAGRKGEGAAQLKAALRQYPNIPVAWLWTIEGLSFYTPEVGFAANAWMELAQQSPELANLIDPIYLTALAGNLAANGEMETLEQLYLALDRIGYAAKDPFTSSAVAYEAFGSLAEDGLEEEARLRLARIADPSKLAQILTYRTFEPYWNDVEFDSAELRTRLVRTWLIESGRAISRSDDAQRFGWFLSTLSPYVEPVLFTGRYEPQLRAVMQRKNRSEADAFYAAWVSPIARAHVNAGNIDAAEAMCKDAELFFDGFANRAKLSVGANYADFLANRGRYREALEKTDSLIAILEEATGNELALLKMKSIRLRALHGLGRDYRSDPAMAAIADARKGVPSLEFELMLDLGDYDAARQQALSLLDGDDYAFVVDAFQPRLGAFGHSYPEAREKTLERLRADPQVLAAVEEKGRILDFEPVAVSLDEWPALDSAP